MGRFRFGLSLLLVLCSVLSASGIELKGKKCYFCGKEIQDLKLAGYWGDKKFFDEPGCMISLRGRKMCPMEQVNFDVEARVLDYKTGEEVLFGDAFFLKGKDIQTPNGYGILAFKNKENATGFDGKLLSHSEMTKMKLSELLK